MRVTNESWYIVRNTPNVTGFLGAWNIPVPVSGKELEQLKGKISEKSQPYSTKYQVGEYVEVTKGPFAGNEWNIVELDEDKWYVKIKINLLGRDTPIELELTQIKAKQ
jgi:transcriptional antiterminator NusG